MPIARRFRWLSRRKGTRWATLADILVDNRANKYGEGTFSRSTSASYYTSGSEDTIAYVAPNVIRYETLGDGAPLMAVFAGDVSQVLTAIYSMDDTAKWSQTNCAVSQPGTLTDPEGNTNAYYVSFSSLVSPPRIEHSVTHTLLDDGTEYIWSVFLKNADGAATVTAQISWYSKSGALASANLTVNPTGVWQQFEINGDAGTGTTKPKVRISNPRTSGDKLNLLVFGPNLVKRLDRDNYASTRFINGNQGAGGRAADVQTYTLNEFDNAMFTQEFEVVVATNQNSGFIPNGKPFVIFAVTNSVSNCVRLNKAAGAYFVQCYASNSLRVNRSFTVDSDNKPVTLRINPAVGSIEIIGADSGDGSTTSGTWNWTAAADYLRIGSALSTNGTDIIQPFFGRISEIRLID